MESTSTRNVTDLASPDRQTLEHLLGKALEGNEQVFIMTYVPGAVPDESVRKAARSRMEQTFAAVDEHAAQIGLSAEEADAAVEEAMERVRPRDS